MLPEQFVEKWAASELKESSAAQEHFIDLCHLLDEPTPAEADPKGEFYCFERGASKTTGGEGWADVWKRHHFGWEYKGKRKNLDQAFAQLQQYAIALENPPLLVVSDMERFRIHTNWTNTISEVHELALDDLLQADKRQLLKSVLSDPRPLKPALTRDALTEKAASGFASLALSLRKRGHDPQAVAHFINRLVFCMFAEDVQLLPGDLFSRMLEAALNRPDQFEGLACQLFGAMQSGGIAGFDRVDWFNGGLFDDDQALPLARNEIETVLAVARMNWADIDPSIFGTLFERGLDPDKRSQLGAHYTDRDKIMMIVEPVVLRPLEADWREARAEIETEMAKAEKARARRPKTQAEARKVHRAARQAEERALRNATKARDEFIEQLRNFRVLDPACGSGNFLYLSLLALKDLEHRALLDAEALGLDRPAPSVGPEVVKGIEINPYAAELARVTVWIGEIQWMKRNGFDVSRNPILKPLDTIECRDALLNEDGTEAEWPAAHAIVGNPPFLGGKLLRDGLGDEYVDQLFATYRNQVRPEADLVCYWFDKARRQINDYRTSLVGLVATNSIRGGANRAVLNRIVSNGTIFEAWDDEPWVVEGAAVRVSLVCFGGADLDSQIALDGKSVARIYADLTSGGVDLTQAAVLRQNRNVAFMGDTKGGAFDIPGSLAREWLQLPLNPNGRLNTDVLRPWVNGMDITRRLADKWIIDFGWEMSANQAALYEAPYEYIDNQVRPVREKNQREIYRKYWWQHVRPRPDMWAAISLVSHCIVTPTVAKHRIFKWCKTTVCPDHQLIVIARDDETTFGIVHSKFHEIWSLRMGTSLEDRPRYTPTTTFETFPFPEGLTPNIPASDYADDPRAVAIADAARRLNELRENWLNPPDLVRREPEVVPGYPDRILPVDDKAAAILKKRTLTNLYNEHPAWLDHAHRELDEAVAAAYGWPADLSDDEILARLFQLNQERAN
jgi:type II restriction/modification system DNA methylase subunit YeeA